MQTNTTSSHIQSLDHIPREEYVLHYFLGTLMALFTIVGISGNAGVITLFSKHSCLRGRTTFLLRSLAFSDGIMALVGGTMYTINCFNHRWVFYHGGCMLYAFVMYWCGVTSIAHLCAISIERAITITNPAWSMANRGKISGYTVAMLVFCWLYGLFWAVLPFFGIQRYTIEGRVSCSIDWLYRDPRYLVYQVVIFASAFLLPLVIMGSCNGIILYVVHKSLFHGHTQGKVSSSLKESQNKEWKVAKSMLSSTSLYLFAWGPYAIVAMWVTFGSVSEIPSLLFTVLGFFAKISFVFNPIVYVGTNTFYRQKIGFSMFKPAVSETSNSMHTATVHMKHTPRNDTDLNLDSSALPESKDGYSDETIKSCTSAGGCRDDGSRNHLAADMPPLQEYNSAEALIPSVDAATVTKEKTAIELDVDGDINEDMADETLPSKMSKPADVGVVTQHSQEAVYL